MIYKKFAISGPSGVGKTTLINKLLNKYPDILLSKSVTTRKLRSGENNSEYDFITVEKFLLMDKNCEIVEKVKMYDNWYGTPKYYIDIDKIVIFNIDPTYGLNILKKLIPSLVSIFILPPNYNELAKRLEARDGHVERLVKYDIPSNFDYTIINDDIEDAFKQLDNIIINNQFV